MSSPQTLMMGRPKVVTFVRILIGVQTFRLIGLVFVTGLQKGTLARCVCDSRLNG